jgi:acyl homoserine lactone synthase
MLIQIDISNRADNLDLLNKSFKLRHQIFKEQLGWDVPSKDGLEFDEFDQVPEVVYFLWLEGQEVLGCLRLLPMCGPNMLRDIFASTLHDEPIPHSNKSIECTRFAVSSKANKTASSRLLIAMVSYALAEGADEIVGVSCLLQERNLRRLGAAPERLAPISDFGGMRVVASRIGVSSETYIDVLDKLNQLETKNAAA